MEEIKVSEMLQADSIEKDNAVMIIQDGVNKKASGSIQTATGTSLSLTSVADTCKVTSNSKNLFDGQLEQGGFNGGTPQDNNTRVRSSNFTKVNANTTYTASVPSNMKVIAIFYNASLIFIGQTDGWVNTTRTFTTPANTEYLKLVIGKQGDGNVTPSEVSNVQIEEGSTATSYNPYNTEVIVSDENLFDGFLNGAYISTTGVWNGSADGKASKKLSVEKGKEYVLSGYTSGQTIRIFHWNNGTYISDTTLTTASINKIIMLGNQFAFQSSSSASYNNVIFATGQYLNLTPDETKSAFTYDTETIVEANNSVTIEYNTQSRLLNNDDVLDIVEPVKEYAKEYADEKIEKAYSNVSLVRGGNQQITGTTETLIQDLSVTIEGTGKPILVLADFLAYAQTSTAQIYIRIDGVKESARVTTIISTTLINYNFSKIIEGLSKGKHTIEIVAVGEASNASIIISAWQNKSLSVIEL